MNKIFYLTLIITNALTAFSQTEISYLNKDTLINNFLFNEGIGLETDQQWYISGESILFTCNTYDYILQTPIDISKVAYIEFFTYENIIIKQLKVKMENGIGNSSITIPKDIPTGIYYIRAYTNYMKNFGITDFNQIPITILNPFINSNINNEPTEKYTLNECNIYPEGENFIINKNNKATCIFSEYYSSPLNVKLINSDDSVITSFKTNEYGIGAFEFTPNLESAYKLVATNNKQEILEKKIPIQNEAISLVYQHSHNDSIAFKINNYGFNSYPLLLKARYKNSIISLLKIYKNDSVIIIPKKSIPYGLVHFQIADTNGITRSSRWVINKRTSEINIALQTDKTEYKTRDSVALNIKYKGNSKEVFYSISITNNSLHADTLNHCENSTKFHNELYPYISNIAIPMNYLLKDSALFDNILIAINNDSLRQKFPPKKYTKLEFIPEIGGDIVSGKITFNPLHNHTNSIITQAFVDSICTLQTSIVDSTGMFYFNINETRENSQMVFTQNSKTDKIVVQEEYTANFFTITREYPCIDKTNLEIIKQRMVNLQISDLYNSSYKNETKNKTRLPFYLNPDITLRIDEYPVFSTFEEFVFEVLPWVTIIRNKGEKFIYISYKGSDEVIGENPLFLVDGVPIMDKNQIMDMKCSLLNSISVVYAKVFYVNDIYDGIIDIKSVKGNADAITNSENIIKTNYIGVSNKSNNSTNTLPETHIPYFKSQLLWVPFKSLNSEKETIETFFTPDHLGNFTIKCCIINSNGLKKYSYQSFMVTDE